MSKKLKRYQHNSKLYNHQYHKLEEIKHHKHGMFYNNNTSTSDDSDMSHFGGGEDDEHFQILSDEWGRVRKVKVMRAANEDLSIFNFLVFK